MSLPKYPAYRDSGIEWIGDVPAHWNVQSLKRTFAVVGGSTPKSEEPSFWDGRIPWATPADLSGAGDLTLNSTQRTITEAGLNSCGTSIVPAGSILVSTRAPIGSVAVASMPVATNQGCRSLVLHRAADGWFFALMLSTLSAELNIRGKGTTFLELSAAELGAFKTPVPPLPEQRHIARFLLRRTQEIDAAIAEQERLIELLTEKRQAVISHAVTKGLSPDAPMKPSGVEWLGDVPAHWQVGPIKRFWQIRDCKHVTPVFVENGIPLASIREAQSKWVNLAGAKMTTPEFYGLLTEGGRRPEPGDLIVSRNATVGEVAQVGPHHPPFAMGQDVVLLRRERSSFSPDFLQFAIQSSVVQGQIAGLLIGSTFKRMNVEEIRTLKVAWPPPEEQARIATHLEGVRVQFQSLTDDSQRTIELLQERRTALITAAVTGQIDVRGYVAPDLTVGPTASPALEMA